MGSTVKKIDENNVLREKELSQWNTPLPLAEELLGHVGVDEKTNVWDPSCGAGNFLSAAEALGARCVWGHDIDREILAKVRAGRRTGGVGCMDFLDRKATISFVREHAIDLIAMNPPYERGQDTEHLARAVEISVSQGIGLLVVLRLVALAGVGRYEDVFSQYPPTEVMVLPERPKFLLGGEQRAVGSPRHDFCAAYWDPESMSTKTKLTWWLP